MNALLWDDENREPSHNTSRAFMECGGKAKRRPRYGFEQWTVDLFGSCIQPKRRRRLNIIHILPLGNLLNLQGSRFEPQSQRDCASKPRVARNELPWVMHLEISNPNGVAALCGGSTQPRGVAAIRATVELIAPSQNCGWTTQSLALKMCIMFRSPLRSAGALHSAGASAPTRNTFGGGSVKIHPPSGADRLRRRQRGAPVLLCRFLI